ncbi:hypothetical protein EHQ90_17845, partial [Leptospira stimsonii]
MKKYVLKLIFVFFLITSFIHCPGGGGGSDMTPILFLLMNGSTNSGNNHSSTTTTKTPYIEKNYINI